MGSGTCCAGFLLDTLHLALRSRLIGSSRRQKLLERLAPEIADMRDALQVVVDEVEVSKLNFGAVFGLVIEVSEEKRQELATRPKGE